VEEFPSNSHQPKATVTEKPAEKVVPRVVEGNVTRRKKPLGTRVREMFLPDGEGSVMDFVFGEVLVPALKDMMTDAVSQGFERMIYGESRSSVRRNRPSTGAFGTPARVAYNQYSSGPRRDDRPSMSRRARGLHDFDEIIIPSRGEAIEVIDSLNDMIRKYESVSVKELYEMVGVEFHYTDEKFGWTDLHNAGVRRVSNGYLLDLPKYEPID
jgi:hypothetical protein